MKLYKPTPATVVRIEMQRNNGRGKGNSKTISVDSQCEKEVNNYLLELFSKPMSVSPLEKTEKIRMQCFVAKGMEKGKVKSFTLYGTTLDRVYDKIMDSLEK
jgi:hypothetical protein